jgi:alkanesulfonate monooxygenase SsuD/methylene tetrahydromethanopterin reductase-like flavin-dependent oxidoreductase (luciferase family)
MSAPETFLAYVAAKTSRIRIGHGVVCLPFRMNHPVKVAERVAMLDILSGGRVDVGAGRGATPQETALYGVDRDRTYDEMDEALRIAVKAWREDPFEWHGPLLDIAPPPDGAFTVLPRVVQAPHPPLFLACTKRDTVTLAAEYGIGALVLGFAGVEEVAELHRIYSDAIAERSGQRLVSTVTNDYFAALCPTIVLDDRERAATIGVRGQRFFAQSISHWYGGGPIPEGVIEEGVDEVAAMEEARELFFATLHEAKIPVAPGQGSTFHHEHAYGDANDAIAYVERLLEAGADEIMCLIQMGTVPQDVCMETIRQWGEHVIPHFRGA